MLQFLYTARQSGGLLKQRATSELLDAINTLSELGLARSFSLRHEFNSVWHRFLNPATTGADQTLTLPLGKERFPFLFQGRAITVNSITLLAKVRTDVQDTHNAGTLRFTIERGRYGPDIDESSTSCAGPGNGVGVGWRFGCGRRCGWMSSGPSGSCRAARARAGIRCSHHRAHP